MIVLVLGSGVCSVACTGVIARRLAGDRDESVRFTG